MNLKSFLDISEPLLAFVGVIAIFKTIIFIFFYFYEKNHYIECTYKHFSEVAIEEIENEYPIKRIVTLNKESHEFFLIGFPGKVINNIKIYEAQRYISWSKQIKYKQVDSVHGTIYSDEYLLVKVHSAETTPPYKLTCRVAGNLVEFTFEYNGRYGIPSRNYKAVKHDIYSLLYSYLRNPL